MNADAVKARLKNFAEKSGCTFQEALTYYGMERIIYRISISPYAEHFILKGGVLLYAIFDRQYERATTDVDLLARQISNSAEEMKDVFTHILSLDSNDAITFSPSALVVENITEFKEYHGLHISSVGLLGRTKIPVSIDIGFGDVIYPNAVKMDFPVILDMEAPKINAYSLESTIAEKLEAIVRIGEWNSRYKDFYDIHILSRKFTFSFSELQAAVLETFKNRGTSPAVDLVSFSNEFTGNPLHQSRWKAFLRKKKALVDISLQDAMQELLQFAQPLFGKEAQKMNHWNPSTMRWE
ncbi:MAG: nucleotidyl transferase AbiEii/AbiGii toxin family protein [Schwartzia sp.]|nr:nucleotidyl transferase AbiEii/AbiGii toxin family protein [Schwartzia sp. (in: firmicutes)]